jgi:hypothetical protein
MVSVVDILDQLNESFKFYKRKRVGYNFTNFRRGGPEISSVKCVRQPSYFIVSSKPESGKCTGLCGKVVVCHISGEKCIMTINDFFSKYDIAESSNIAYPIKELVEAFFPDKRFIDKLGDNVTFENFWGRKDEISENTVVIKYAPGEYYVKNREFFKLMYTDDTRDRTNINVGSRSQNKTKTLDPLKKSLPRKNTNTKPVSSLVPKGFE